jgi:hypothetical protein
MSRLREINWNKAKRVSLPGRAPFRTMALLQHHQGDGRQHQQAKEPG